MEEVLKKIQKKIKKLDIDYLDIRLEETKGVSFSIRKSEVETISEEDSVGYGVRALYRGKWGFVSSDNIENIDKNIDKVVASAKLIGDSKTLFAKTKVNIDDVKSPMDVDPIEISLDEKIDLFMDYYKLIIGYDNKIIDSSTVYYGDSKRIKYFLNSEGSFIKQETRRVGYSVNARSMQGDNRQIAYTTNSSLDSYEIIYDLSDCIKETCRLALELLDAKPVKAGEYTVICDQEMAGLFAHEAFGHLSEADNIHKDKVMQKVMKLKRKFGKPFLNIVEDPSMKYNYGSYKYDDEGVLSKKNYLLKNGLLNKRLHNRETAGILKEEPTGNSRAIGYYFHPIVRMSNTYIENSESSFESMIKDVKLGVYVVGAGGGSTNTESFTFAAMLGYMIRDGRIAEMVKDVKLSGNVFHTMNNIDKVGNDLKMISGPGGCGKDGQRLLPTSKGGPHIRIRKLVIGGE